MIIMPPPVGKHRQIVSGRAPWNTLDACKVTEDSKQQSFIHKTPQPEIDVCLSCKKVTCSGTECYEIKRIRDKAFEERKTKYSKEPPPGFEKDARAGMRNYELREKYGLTKYLVTRYIRQLGIVKQGPDMTDFEKDAREGMPIRLLGAKYHMGNVRVKKLLNEYGIERKRNCMVVVRTDRQTKI